MTKAEKTMFLSVLATPIAREGWPFIAVFGIATLILFIFSTVLGWIGVILTLWCIYFFRNPDRVTPQRAGLIISPARLCPANIKGFISTPYLACNLPIK